MAKMISDTLQKLFPGDFEEFRPVKKHWWEKVDFKNLKSKEAFWVTVVLALILIPAIYDYNKFIELSRFTEMESHQIEVILQRRKDLSINLTRTVIDYAEHERNMFQYMADKRADSLKKTDMLIDALKKSGLVEMMDKMKAGTGGTEDALAKFMALGEAYPELKLSGNFQKLMDSLVNSEDKIAERRMAYNHAASVFHAYVKQFPACIYAYVYGYREKMFHYIDVDKDVKECNRIKY
ncbi:MAG: LemA family protein [Candidatus Omnitrophica bacterium]|nr:LemA family protein [Candidatus Omnitrophota bacterium]